MSDTPKKRPFFQFHLSTLIVLTFLAARLLWANMAGQEWVSQSNHAPHVTYCNTDYGWPVHSVTRYFVTEVDGKRIEPSHLVSDIWKWQWCACDAIVALAICGTIAFLLERRIRRRERRQ